MGDTDDTKLEDLLEYALVTDNISLSEFLLLQEVDDDEECLEYLKKLNK